MKNEDKPILIKSIGDLQVFRCPKTGKEFAATCNRPVAGMFNDDRFSVTIFFDKDRPLNNAIMKLRAAVPAFGDMHAKDILLLVKSTPDRSVKIRNLFQWEIQRMFVGLDGAGFTYKTEKEVDG